MQRRSGDAADVDDVVAASTGQDVLISATRPAPGREGELVATARALLAGVRATGTRLLLVGGAASLALAGGNGKRVLDDPAWVPPAWQPIARACLDQLEVCLGEKRADWTYLSPPAVLEPGRRSGSYRIGEDELLVDAEGASRISVEDLAVTLLDEVERPRHHRARFTVAY